MPLHATCQLTDTDCDQGAYIATINIESSDTAVSKPLSSGGTAAVFFFYLWTAFYTPSWNGTPWVLNSEMFDQSVRSLGQASAAMNNWFWWVFLESLGTNVHQLICFYRNFIISRFTPQMFLSMGKNGCGVYFFFASMMLVSILFVFFLIPETKGIPLESSEYNILHNFKSPQQLTTQKF